MEMGNNIQYKCLECNEYGDAKSWDEETLKHYDESEHKYVLSIENNKDNCYFHCLNCKLDIKGENIRINNVHEINDNYESDIKTTIVKIIINQLPNDCNACTLHEGEYCKIKGAVTDSEWVDLYSNSRDIKCPLEEY